MATSCASAVFVGESSTPKDLKCHERTNVVVYVFGDESAYKLGKNVEVSKDSYSTRC